MTIGPAQHITATILGCGSSGGVPRVGGDWGVCDPEEPRNRRQRCALLITGTRDSCVGKTQILIDTGCDMRTQLLDAGVKALDAVFYTHEHADHTHGIDDLRSLALLNSQRIDVYFGERAGAHIRRCFTYCFSTPQGSGYPPILNAHEIYPQKPIEITGKGGRITLLPILQEHGAISTFGFRIADFLYSCDVSDFPEESLEALAGLKTWVIDALRPTPHASHLSLPEALHWIERMQPKHAILTNLHVDMDYQRISAQTPDSVEMAYDGMVLKVL